MEERDRTETGERREWNKWEEGRMNRVKVDC